LSANDNSNEWVPQDVFDDMPYFLQKALVDCGLAPREWLNESPYTTDWQQQMQLGSYFGFLAPGGLAPMYAENMINRAWRASYFGDPGIFGYQGREVQAQATQLGYLERSMTSRGRYDSYLTSQADLWGARAAEWNFQQNWTPAAEAWGALKIASYFSPQAWTVRALGFPFYSAAQKLGVGAAMAPEVRAALAADPYSTGQVGQYSVTNPMTASVTNRMAASSMFWPGQYGSLRSALVGGLVEWTGIQQAAWMLGGRGGGQGMLGVNLLQAGLGLMIDPLATMAVRSMWGQPLVLPGEQFNVATRLLGGAALTGVGGYLALKGAAFAPRNTAFQMRLDVLPTADVDVAAWARGLTGLQTGLRVGLGALGWIGGSWVGGDVGEFLGEKYFGEPYVGRVLGTVAGGLGGQWAAMQFAEPLATRIATRFPESVALLGGISDVAAAVGPGALSVLELATLTGQAYASYRQTQYIQSFGGMQQQPYWQTGVGPQPFAPVDLQTIHMIALSPQPAGGYASQFSNLYGPGAYFPKAYSGLFTSPERQVWNAATDVKKYEQLTAMEQRAWEGRYQQFRVQDAWLYSRVYTGRPGMGNEYVPGERLPRGMFETIYGTANTFGPTLNPFPRSMFQTPYGTIDTLGAGGYGQEITPGRGGYQTIYGPTTSPDIGIDAYNPNQLSPWSIGDQLLNRTVIRNAGGLQAFARRGGLSDVLSAELDASVASLATKVAIEYIVPRNLQAMNQMIATGNVDLSLLISQNPRSFGAGVLSQGAQRILQQGLAGEIAGMVGGAIRPVFGTVTTRSGTYTLGYYQTANFLNQPGVTTQPWSGFNPMRAALNAVGLETRAPVTVADIKYVDPQGNAYTIDPRTTTRTVYPVGLMLGGAFYANAEINVDAGTGWRGTDVEVTNPSTGMVERWNRNTGMRSGEINRNPNIRLHKEVWGGQVRGWYDPTYGAAPLKSSESGTMTGDATEALVRRVVRQMIDDEVIAGHPSTWSPSLITHVVNAIGPRQSMKTYDDLSRS